MIWLASFVLLVVGAAVLSSRTIRRHWTPTGRPVLDRVVSGLAVLAALAVAAQLYLLISGVQLALTTEPSLGEALKQIALVLASSVVDAARTIGPLVALVALVDHVARRLPPVSRLT
jgi:hypothetical protein